MKEQQLLWIVLSFMLSYLSKGNSLRILSIGDSIDRYMLHDWCLHTNGTFCPTVSDRGAEQKSIHCTVSTTRPNTVFSYFRQTIQVYSWEISVCENFRENITLGFLFNKQGVFPSPPWFQPSRSHLGLTGYNMSQQKSVKGLFNYFLGPALPNLFRVMGGLPDAISMNSCLWDAARMLAYGGLGICNMSSKRREWVKSWAKNASDFVDAIHEAAPTVRWMGWRMSHNVTYPDPPCRWDMIHEMNEAAHQMAKSKNLHWEPWLARHPLVNVDMRDHIHPGPTPNIDHMNALITQVRHDFKKNKY